MRHLVGVGGAKACAAGDSRRSEGGFSASDAGVADGERDEDIVVERVVVEEIARAGPEVGDIQSPAGDRNGDAEFALLVAFTVER